MCCHSETRLLRKNGQFFFFFSCCTKVKLNKGTPSMDHRHCKIFPLNTTVAVFSNQDRQEASDSSLINVLMLLPDTLCYRVTYPGERQSHLHQHAYVSTGFRCVATTTTCRFRPLRCPKVAIIISQLCNIRGNVPSPLRCPKFR